MASQPRCNCWSQFIDLQSSWEKNRSVVVSSCPWVTSVIGSHFGCTFLRTIFIPHDSHDVDFSYFFSPLPWSTMAEPFMNLTMYFSTLKGPEDRPRKVHLHVPSDFPTASLLVLIRVFFSTAAHDRFSLCRAKGLLRRPGAIPLCHLQQRHSIKTV